MCYHTGKLASHGGGKVARKIERLRGLLEPDGEMKELATLDDSVSLPQRPEVRVKGVVPGSALILKSALCPFVLEFIVEKYPINRKSSAAPGN